MTAQPDALEQLRVEIAQEHGLGRDGAQFLTGTTLQEIETQAAQLRKVCAHRGGSGRRKQHHLNYHTSAANARADLPVWCVQRECNNRARAS